MSTSTSISLDAANRIIASGIRLARAHNYRPLTLVVLDRGGYVVAAEREDDSGILRFDIAYGKAWGRLALSPSSGSAEAELSDIAGALPALAAAAGGRYVAGPGAMLIRNDAGTLVGAFGVTGESAGNERSLATQAIEASGFKADPGHCA